MQSSKTIAENMIPCNVPAFFSSFEKKIEKYSQSNSYLQELTEQLTNQCLKQQNDISAMKLEFYAFQTKYLSQIDTQPPSPSVQPVFQQDTTFTVIVPPRLLSPPPLAWGFFQTVTGERIFLVTQTGIQPLSLEHGTLALRESSDQFMQICMFRFCDTVAHDTFIIENIGRQEVIVGQLSTKLAYGERSELVDGAVVQLDKETSVTFHAIHAPGPTSVLIHEILNFDESSSLIGCGATASVFKATCKASGEQVAVKRVDLRGGYFHFDWNMEVEAINKLGSHPRFVELKEVLDEGPFRYLVMELVRGGDLESHLREQGNLTAENTLRLALQISEGIKHMHSVGVTHRDLKPENILCMELDDEISFKIADFGTASFGKLMVSVCGTPGYSANEVFGRTNNNEPYDSGVDCFSLGKILFKARFGVLPPPDLSKMENELLDQRDVQLLAFVKSLVCSASTRLKSHELFNHEYFAVAKDKFSGEVIQKFSPHLRREKRFDVFLERIKGLSRSNRTRHQQANEESVANSNGKELTSQTGCSPRQNACMAISPDNPENHPDCLPCHSSSSIISDNVTPTAQPRSRQQEQQSQENSTLCKFWLSSDGCKKGDLCRFMHPAEEGKLADFCVGIQPCTKASCRFRH